MQQPDPVKRVEKYSISTRLRDYMLLVKFSLTILVVFSAVISYLLAPKVVEFDWAMIGILVLAGFFVTGSANAGEYRLQYHRPHPPPPVGMDK